MSCTVLVDRVNDDAQRLHGAGIYIIQTLLQPGAEVVQHVHKYDHLSVIPRTGRVELTVEGEKRILIGPCAVVIEAGKKHSVRALTPVLWQCIHRVDGEVTDEAATEKEMRA
jgi:quercetin dioxygenase-like cupin family protein